MTQPPAKTVKAFAQLASFLTGGRLTQVVANLEHAMNGASSADAERASAAAGLDRNLLEAALLVRRDLGRLNDLIHATAISLALPRILVGDEHIVNRPSLAAGNDSTRKYDLETDRRVAEFKVSVWTGADAMRKRGVFHDLVNLAADTSGRDAELYVVGERPIRFLRDSRSSANWGLSHGADSTRQVFVERFGSLDMPIRDFTADAAAHVQIVDLSELLPELLVALAAVNPAAGT